MKRVHRSRHSFTRGNARRAVSTGLALLAAQGVLSAAAFAQAASIITYGQVVQGALGDATDAMLQDGRPIDRYRLTTQVPNQAYAVFAASPEIPIASTVLYFDPSAGAYVPLQRANTFGAGQRTLYAGSLPQPGTYLIDIYPQDLQQPVGSYTLSLCGDDDDDDDADDLGDLDDLDDCFGDDDGVSPAPGGGVGGAPGAPGSDDDDDDDDDSDD